VHSKKLAINVIAEEPQKTMKETLRLMFFKAVPENVNNNNSFLLQKLEVFTSLRYFL
jgi:DNA gyrase inhibitor GyrI